MLAILAIPFLLLMLAALAGNVIQHRLVWSFETLTPKLSKISPMSGLKRLFSKQALVNFAKGMVKLLLIGVVLIALMWPERGRLMALVGADSAALLAVTQSLALKQLGAVVAILAVVAAADYLFQYRVWYERQKMSLRELKDEFKQSEGDPTIKGKMRQVRQTRQRRRMMANVPKAAVVITNPTHYSIALQYERGMDAPVCVAKGVDAVAMRIRDARRRAFHPDRGESAAGARAARHGRSRRGYSARTLQGGRRGDRLCHAPAPGGSAVIIQRPQLSVSLNTCAAGAA